MSAEERAAGREGMKSTAARSASGWQPFDVIVLPRAQHLGPGLRDIAVERVRRADGAGIYAARVVNCDATWQDGIGFIAVTGALGAHARRVECANSVIAEALVILFAMELGEATAPERPPALIFRTDCAPVASGVQPGIKANRDRRLGSLLTQIKRTLRHRRQWELQHVDRDKVRAAHALAGRARRAYTRGEPGSAVDVPPWAPS
jgi:hypothetical protein